MISVFLGITGCDETTFDGLDAESFKKTVMKDNLLNSKESLKVQKFLACMGRKEEIGQETFNETQIFKQQRKKEKCEHRRQKWF